MQTGHEWNRGTRGGQDFCILKPCTWIRAGLGFYSTPLSEEEYLKLYNAPGNTLDGHTFEEGNKWMREHYPNLPVPSAVPEDE